MSSLTEDLKEANKIVLDKYKKKIIPHIDKKKIKDIVKTAKDAFKSLKKHYPKIGTDY